MMFEGESTTHFYYFEEIICMSSLCRGVQFLNTSHGGQWWAVQPSKASQFVPHVWKPGTGMSHLKGRDVCLHILVLYYKVHSYCSMLQHLHAYRALGARGAPVQFYFLNLLPFKSFFFVFCISAEKNHHTVYANSGECFVNVLLISVYE